MPNDGQGTAIERVIAWCLGLSCPYAALEANIEVSEACVMDGTTPSCPGNVAFLGWVPEMKLLIAISINNIMHTTVDIRQYKTHFWL